MSRKLIALLLAVLMLPLSTINSIAEESDPDITINEITFSNNSPTGGDTINITAEIANDGGPLGTQPVTINVTFYWDNKHIGNDSVYIAGSSTADAVVSWRAVGGTHTIKAVADEANTQRESDETNNVKEQNINVEYPPILLLDDDNSDNNGGYKFETDSYYVNALENLTNPVGYDLLRVPTGEDGPSLNTLNKYSMIIWVCGYDYTSGDDITFTENDKKNVSEYLDAGGSMWIVGQDILYDFDSLDGEREEGDFEYDYLGVAYVDHDRTTPEVISGVDGDPISDGIEYSADSISSDFADDINPRDEFYKVFNSGAQGDEDAYNVSTIRTEDSISLVFMTLDFSSVTSPDDRDELMYLIVDYLLVTYENDVSLSRFNAPKDKNTVEPGVENTINLTVRNRGTEDQDTVVVSIEIDCKNNSYTHTEQTTISISSGEGAFVEFEWDVPGDEDYEYEIKAEAHIEDDEKEENDIKDIDVNTYVIYDLELSEARVNPMIAEKGTDRDMNVIVTNTGDVTMNSDITGKVHDGAGEVIYNGQTKEVDLSPGESQTLEWEWQTDQYGTFWFEAEVIDDNDEIPENDVSSAVMRSVDIEFSDNMENGRNGWNDYNSLANPWHLINTNDDGDREAASPTHSMWIGDESKGNGEYEDGWDFSIYSSDNISLGASPQMRINIWYNTETNWDGGNVQISTDGGENWEVINPDGGYPDSDVAGLDYEPGYSGNSGGGEDPVWEAETFSLTNYSNQDVKFRFRFGSDGSVNNYEGWYLDDFEIRNGAVTTKEDDFENGDDNWVSDVVLSEWNYLNKDEEFGKVYSGEYSWYLGKKDTGLYSPSLNDSLETPTIDLGDGSEKYVSAMIWYGIDGPYDYGALEINISGEWETVETFPGDDGDFSEEYEDADENGWLYREIDVSEYEGEVTFRLRFVSNTYTQYDGLYVDNFAVYSLPPLPNDVGTRELDAPETAKPGRQVTFYSDIYNYGTENQDEFGVRGKITRDDGTVVYNQTQIIDGLDSKKNKTLEWNWEGGPEGTYTIKVETLLEGDERAGNNPKEKSIDIAESGYQIALEVQQQAKEMLSGESVFFNFTATNTGEKSGYYDITVGYGEEDDWRIISLLQYVYLSTGSSQNFSVSVIAPTLAPSGDQHEFSVTVTSRDDPETEDSQNISATPIYREQAGGDNVLLIDANFGKNNGYNNYQDIDKIDIKMKNALQSYFSPDGEGESIGYDVYTIPYNTDLDNGQLDPYPTNNLMSEYDVVIWVQGDHHQRNNTVWKNCIKDYLDSGGNFWIIGQQFMSALNSTTGPREEGSFEYDYLMVEGVSDGSGTSNPLVGVEGDEIFGGSEYGMGERSIISYDYADWIKPRDEAVGAFYTGNTNWWHIVDVTEDPNREANSPTHSMWIGNEAKNSGEYESGWDYSIYTSQSYSLGIGGQLSFNHWYSTEYSWDGGNVQISTDNGDSWVVISPDGGYPDNAVVALDNEPGYTGTSGGGDEPAWESETFSLTNYSNQDVRFRFRFGSDSIIDSYEGWYFDDVQLSDNSGTVFSDDMESGMGNWDDAAQIFNLSIYYEGNYRLILSPFTFAFFNNSDDGNDFIARGLDWLIAGSAANDVGVKILELTSETNENSTIEFSSVIRNYGSEDQTAINVEAQIKNSKGETLWSDSEIIEFLESGDEKSIEWEWESGNPEEITITVETTKNDENPRNNLKEIETMVNMIHVPEVSTFNDNKEGGRGTKVTFDITIKNNATGFDNFDLEMTGSASTWGSIANNVELDSKETWDFPLRLDVPEDIENEKDYDLNLYVTGGDVTEILELVITVTDNPANYAVEIVSVDPDDWTEIIASQELSFTTTIRNDGDKQDTFDLEGIEDFGSWVEFEENEVLLESGSEITVLGKIKVPEDADDGKEYIEFRVTSRGDRSVYDDDLIKIDIEELELKATLKREGSGIKTIAPGASDAFEYRLINDGNVEQDFDVIVSGEAGQWASISNDKFTLGPNLDTCQECEAPLTVTLQIPAGTPEATYRLEVLIMNGEQELTKSISNVVVQMPFIENLDIAICLTDLSGMCLNSENLEITIEANKIQTASAGFIVENRGNVDSEIAFKLLMPDGTTGTDLYFDENVKEWRVAISPADTTEYPIEIDAGESIDWGAVAVIAREVLPGTYTFGLTLMKATESDTGYVFENLGYVTITVIVEGDELQDSQTTDDQSLLPGPSFLSIIIILATIVYRKKR